MYTLLNAGKVPFTDTCDDRTAIHKRINGDKLPRIKGISADMMKIIYKLCEVDPNKRYHSAMRLIHALKLLVKKKENEKQRCERRIEAQLIRKNNRQNNIQKRKELVKNAPVIYSQNINYSDTIPIAGQKKESVTDYDATINAHQQLTEIISSPVIKKHIFYKSKKIAMYSVAVFALIGVIGVTSFYSNNVIIAGMVVDRDCSTLDLSNRPIDSLSLVEKCRQLEYLNLNGTDISPESIAEFSRRFPDCRIQWDLEIAGKSIDCTSETLDFSNCVFDNPSEVKNLRYLPHLQSVDFSGCSLSDDQILEIQDILPDCSFLWTVDLFGTKYNTGTTQISLSGISVSDLPELKKKIRCFNNLTSLSLENSDIDNETAYELSQSFPQIDIIWTVSMFGKKFSSNASSLDLSGNVVDSLDELKANLKYFPFVNKIDLSDSGFDNETLHEFNLSLDGIDVCWSIEFYGKTYKTDITLLSLDSSNLSDISDLKYFTNMRILSLSYGANSSGIYYWGQRGGISDISALSGMTKLTKLSLRGNQISDISPLENLTSLKRLWLDHNNISDIAPLSGLTQLDTLSLMENNISDISPLERLNNINRLCLSHNRINNASVLSELKELKQVNITNNNISDFTPFHKLTSLEFLYIGGNNIGTKQRSELQNALPKCTISYDSISEKLFHTDI